MDLDSLNLRITASTDQATKSIDKLIDTLGRLNGAFNIGGIDTFTGSLDAIATSLNSINSAPLKSLADSAARLAKVGKGSFDGVVSGMRSLKSAMPHESTIANMAALRDAVSKLGGKQGAVAGNALRDIASGIQALNIPIPNISTELGELAAGLRSLGSGNIVKASTSLTGVANGLNALKSVGTIPQIAGLADLGKAISVFGRKSASEAIVVIPQLAAAFRKMIETLSKAPSVKQSIIDMANAMANLTKNAKSVAPATRSAISGLNLFSVQAKKTQKTTFSLASAIGKLYASYWMLMRVFRIAGSNIKMASDLTETQNVVDHVFGQMKDDMEDFAKTSVETVGMSELTAKQIGSKFQAMASNMDISDKMLKNTNEFVQGLAIDYGRATESISDMSINLTQLAGDMASFYNLPYEDVAEDLESIFTGQIKPMRRFGVDLSVASLKAFALANGLNADIKNMTLAEKAMLRYQYVMAHTTAAQGDFARTSDTWANTLKVAQENLKRLQIILGQIGIYTFKPLVQNFNVAMNDILHIAEETFNALGTIFGWKLEVSDAGVLDDVSDGLEDISDGYDDASKEAKKFKNFLLGIDELNLLPENKDKNGSGDDAELGAMANGLQKALVNLEKTESGFDSIYDTLFKLGKRAGEVEKEWLQSIDWDAIYEKARDFGTGLASLLNGYLSDSELFYEKGKFIADSINTIANALDAFFQEFDGKQLGIDLGTMVNGFTENLDWAVIESAAQGFATDFFEMINGFFETTKFGDIATTIATGLNVALEAIYTIGDGIEWENIGQAISDFVNNFFDPEEGFDFTLLGETINTWIDGIQKTLKTAFSGDEKGEGGINWKDVMSGFNDFFDTVELDNVAFVIGVITVTNVAKWVFSGAALKALTTALGSLITKAIAKIGIGSAISKALASAGSLMTVDIATIFGAGTALEIGFAIGAAIVGGIAAAIGGFELGKLLGRLFTDDDSWYRNFKWFGDDGFFKTVFGDIESAIDGAVLMLTDFANHPVIATLANVCFGIVAPLIEGVKLLKDAIKEAGGLGQILEDIGVAIFQPIDEAITFWGDAFKRLGDGFKGLINDAKFWWDDFFNSIGSGISDFVYDCIKWWQFLFDDIAKGISNWWKNDVVPWFSFDTWLDLFYAIYDAMGEMWDNLMDWWNNTAIGKWVDDNLTPFFSVDNWMGFFQCIIDAFEKSFEIIIQTFKDLWNGFADFINSNIKITVPEVHLPFGAGTIPETTIGLNIPKFATGGSIPNDGSLFIANERGAEVVANMGSRTGVMNTDQMEQAVANGMARALANNNQNVTVVLNGDAATFFTAMVKENNNYIMRTGASPMRV